MNWEEIYELIRMKVPTMTHDQAKQLAVFIVTNINKSEDTHEEDN